MAKANVTPFGVRLCGADDFYDVEAFSVFDDLLTEYRNGTWKEEPLELVTRTIQAAEPLLGKWPLNRLKAILNGNEIITQNDHHYEFVKDTIKFIECGQRDMRIQSRVQFLDLHEANGYKRVAAGDLVMYFRQRDKLKDKQNLPVKPVEAGEQWVSWLKRENGFNDMLLTLAVLYGNPEKHFVATN